MTTSNVKELEMRNNIKEMTVFFRRYYDGTEVKMKVPHSDSSITELTDMYLDFLRGCGFIDPERGVLEHMVDNYDDKRYSIPTTLPKEVSNVTKKRF